MKIHFYTIGVYGSSDADFFNKLTSNKIDTFCDIRRRRAVRGSLYSFVNSKRLQDKLRKLGINYLYESDLAPTEKIRQLQKSRDKSDKVGQREREKLDDDFRSEYIKEIISKFDFGAFIDRLEKEGARKVVFFCVERSASACHRSLVTDKLKEVFPKMMVRNL